MKYLERQVSILNTEDLKNALCEIDYKEMSGYGERGNFLTKIKEGHIWYDCCGGGGTAQSGLVIWNEISEKMGGYQETEKEWIERMKKLPIFDMKKIVDDRIEYLKSFIEANETTARPEYIEEMKRELQGLTK